MKPIDQMSAVELCEAIKAEGARLGVVVGTWGTDDGDTFVGMMLDPDRGGHIVCVWMSWEFYGTDYTLDELRECLQRWMSLRCEV